MATATLDGIVKGSWYYQVDPRRLIGALRPGTRPQEGMALVVALMLLSIISLLGASALLTTNVEVKISGNTRTGRTAFYAADGVGQTTSNIIEDNIEATGWSDGYSYATGVTVNHGSFGFMAVTKDLASNPDITFADPMPGTANVDKGATVAVAGSSSLTAAGYEGAGKGAAGGGVKVVYLIHTRGILGSRATSLLFITHDHF